jgi:hypothetical protein
MGFSPLLIPLSSALLMMTMMITAILLPLANAAGESRICFPLDIRGAMPNEVGRPTPTTRSYLILVVYHIGEKACESNACFRFHMPIYSAHPSETPLAL